MNGTHEVQIARLQERVSGLERQLEESRLARAELRDRLDLYGVRLERIESHVTHVDTDLSSINASMTWLIRLIIGLVVTILLTAVISGLTGHLGLH